MKLELEKIYIHVRKIFDNKEKGGGGGGSGKLEPPTRSGYM